MTEDYNSLEAWLDEAEQNILRVAALITLAADSFGEVRALMAKAEQDKQPAEQEAAPATKKKRAPRKKKAAEPAPAPVEVKAEPVDPVEEFRALAMGNLSKAGRLVRTEGGSRFTDLSAAKQTKVLEALRNG